MTQDDLQKEIRELRAQIEALRSALSDVTRPYTELMAYVGRLQDVSRGYFRILDLYAKYGKVSPDLVIPGLKDDISRHIVVATPSSRTRTFRVAEEVAEKWSQVLGVAKYRDQPREDSDKVGEGNE